MEYKFELPENISKDELVICFYDKPEPIAYLNVFEEGDVWLKTKGCENCKNKSRRCSGCPLFIDDKCLYQIGNNLIQSKKPYHCVVTPSPKDTYNWCEIEFKCISGKNKDKIKQVKIPHYDIQEKDIR